MCYLIFPPPERWSIEGSALGYSRLCVSLTHPSTADVVNRKTAGAAAPAAKKRESFLPDAVSILAMIFAAPIVSMMEPYQFYYATSDRVLLYCIPLTRGFRRPRPIKNRRAYPR